MSFQSGKSWYESDGSEISHWLTERPTRETPPVSPHRNLIGARAIARALRDAHVRTLKMMSVTASNARVAPVAGRCDARGGGHRLATRGEAAAGAASARDGRDTRVGRGDRHHLECADVCVAEYPRDGARPDKIAMWRNWWRQRCRPSVGQWEISEPSDSYQNFRLKRHIAHLFIFFFPSRRENSKPSRALHPTPSRMHKCTTTYVGSIDRVASSRSRTENENARLPAQQHPPFLAPPGPSTSTVSGR